LMLIFVAGHFPILGTQMLYFADPTLAKRAETAPPAKFIAIEAGKVAEQRPSDRTAHVISQPEVVTAEESQRQIYERVYLRDPQQREDA